MLLREHPLFRLYNLSSWPPVWTWMSGGYINYPRGEVGILRRVEKSNILPADRCFLYIDAFSILTTTERHTSAAFYAAITFSALRL